MALFMGVSIVSIIECICYAGFRVSTLWCEPSYVDDEDEDEGPKNRGVPPRSMRTSLDSANRPQQRGNGQLPYHR